MKVVTVNFVSTIHKNSQGKPLTTTSSVLCDDDVDSYDVLTEFEGCYELGWIPGKVSVVREGIRIHRDSGGF